MKTIFTFFWLLLFALPALAQLQGRVTSEAGEPLAFASIYVEGTSKGTSTNSDGVYVFELDPGTYRIVFQYIGYKQKVINASISSGIKKLDVILEEETVELKEIVVKANAEDPAYPIIRKAIAKRSYYKNLVKEFTCDVYIKGNHKLLDAPEKILGQEIGDLGGSLDSNRQGIIYLSESLAKLYVRRPDKMKEHMLSSKVSGNDNGFGFNQASLMDFSFYDNHIEIERKLLSPIANTALQYYRYKLMGTFFDEQGHLINKIQVIPKRNEDPVFRGYIYIVEDLWNIQSTDLMLTGSSIKQPVLDTLFIRQVHVPVHAPDVWMQLSQTLDFRFGLFGFDVTGQFAGVFSNYDIQPDLPDDFFDNEIFKVEDGANEKDLTFWESIRPIPLTVEEERDYIKKDSLQVIWKSKPYMDSIDQVQNKFKVFDLLFGYEWKNSHKKESFKIGSPLTTTQFNPIQGFYGNIDITYFKGFDDYNMKWYSINPNIQYGFGDERFRGELGVTYNFNRTKFTRLRISGGSMAAQINRTNPITPFLNTYYSLFGKKNYIKLYQKDYGRIHLRHEIVNGLFFRGSLEYEHRSELTNSSNYSFFKKDEVYEPNLSLRPGNPDGQSAYQAFILNLTFRIRIQQKYLTYPDRKYNLDSKYPNFWINYRKGIAALGSDVDFDQFQINVTDDLYFGLVGRSEINLEVGAFLNDKQLSLIDYKHFTGNQTFIGNPFHYLRSFMQLPYYEYSTNKLYSQIHYQHHFEGFLLDKIPLLRKLNWKSVAATSILFNKDRKPYYEISFGLDNIGIGALRIFRVDIVSNFSGGNYLDTGVMIGVKL